MAIRKTMLTYMITNRSILAKGQGLRYGRAFIKHQGNKFLAGACMGKGDVETGCDLGAWLLDAKQEPLAQVASVFTYVHGQRCGVVR